MGKSGMVMEMNGGAAHTAALIVGGGAAGMLAAVRAAERGLAVTLVEGQSVFGKKLRLTGKGRCNVCNACAPTEALRAVTRNPKFLYSAFHRFPAEETMRFFEGLGVPLKTERGKRVFPVSDRASDVAEALIRRMRQLGVRCVQDRAVELLAEDGHICGVRTAGGSLACSRVLLCTGGLSYPGTGSTGDGYRMAAALGHTITPLRASLVPLECEAEDRADCEAMQGFSLRNVKLTARDAGGTVRWSGQGEMLFTHFGVTGPLVLSASAHLREPEEGRGAKSVEGAGRYCLEIDLKPALDEERLNARVLRDFEKYKNRAFRNALDDLAGRSMIPVLLRRSGIPPDTKVHSVTREQRHRLVKLFKAFSLRVRGPRPIAEAIVTSGGIAVGEVNPHTMESRLVEGLFFAGEILDVDAYTGGFNLQIAWSTAHLAAAHL